MKRLIKKLTALAVMVAVTMSLVPSAFAYHTRAAYRDGFRVIDIGGGGEHIQFPIYNPLPVDVPETHWAKEAISIVINTDPYPLFVGCEQVPNEETGYMGLVVNEIECDMMNGYEDGTFRPDNSMTKLEFIKVLGTNFVGYMNYSLSSDEYKFYEQLNVPEWASDSMRNLCVRNIVNRTDTDLVNYNEPITRAEIAKLISRTYAYGFIYPPGLTAEDYGFFDPKPDRGIDYNDINLTAENYNTAAITDWNTIPAEYQPYVAYAYAKGMMSGYEDGTFKSNKTVTRAEAATLFVNMMRTERFRDNMTDINGEYESLRANGHDVDLFDYFAKPTDTGEPFDTHWKEWMYHM